jgi:TonB dependent receptor
MQKYLSGYLSQPNLTGFSGNNFVENRLQTDTNNSWQIRLDHNFNERNNMFLRLSQMWVEHIQPIATTPSKYHAFNFGGGYDHIFSPGLILDVRAGALMKPYTFNESQAAAGITPATAAGFQNLDQYGAMVVNLAAPYITSDIGQRGVSDRGNPGVSWDDSVTWIKGKHNIKTGAQFIYVNRLQSNLFQAFSFADAQTSNVGAARTGNSLASGLLSVPSGYSAQSPQLGEVFLRFNVWSGYIQDEWKLRPNLTVNLGLRYHYLPQVVILNDRIASALNLFTQQYVVGATSVAACGSPVSVPCIPGGISSVPFNSHIVFSGVRNLVPPAVGDNWGPRIGIAWQLAMNTVLRAGYGLFYDTVSARSQYAKNNLEAAVWPWTTGVNSQSANVSAAGVWPGGPGNPLTLITNLGGSFP